MCDFFTDRRRVRRARHGHLRRPRAHPRVAGARAWPRWWAGSTPPSGTWWATTGPCTTGTTSCPRPTGDDGTYLFSGITVLDYAGDHLWSREEDLYNEVEMNNVLQAWLAAGGRLVRRRGGLSRWPVLSTASGGRAGRAGPRALRRHGAGRPGRRRGQRRPAPTACSGSDPRRPRATSTAAVAARWPSTSSRPTGSRWCAGWPAGADVFVEGFRPGVAERLGSGPTTCRRRHPELVYARMTGLGPGGSAGGQGRPRPQLRRRWPVRWPTSVGPANPRRSAAQPAGRLRRWRPAAGPGRVRRAGRAGHLGPGPGHRRGHGRRRGPAVRAPSGRPTTAATSPPSAAPTCSTAARPSTTATRPRTASWLSVAPLEPQFYADLLVGLELADAVGLARRPGPRPRRRGQLAGAAGSGSPRSSRRRSLDELARRLRRPRRLRGSGAALHRGGRPTPTSRPGAPGSNIDGVIQPSPAPRFDRTPDRPRPAARARRPPHRRGAGRRRVRRPTRSLSSAPTGAVA